MTDIPVALQLYSVREEMAKDFKGTLRRVADMGYEGVEFAGLFDNDPEEVGDLCEQLGLGIAGAHVQINQIQEFELQATMATMIALGNDFIVVPWLPEEYRDSVEAWKRTANVFSASVEKVTQQDLELGYHNHKEEFMPLEGEIPWDVFMENTRLEVFGQLDVGHCLRAGQDPLLYLQKYPGRYLTVHVKDFDPDNENALVGEGIADWEAIFAACEDVAGTEWYIIEQEEYPVPPMESVRKCLENVNEMLGR
ncbi:MAG: sugar phosphate isomerase/epimerase [candidate division WS1 bacterium]|jgi:sugar phosphate isomerase/epimerase|nr:sugar phosphate isomerase/epimerase [candidate division WS1 bacterium]